MSIQLDSREKVGRSLALLASRAAASGDRSQVRLAGAWQIAIARFRSPSNNSVLRFANAVSEDEAKEFYDTFAVPASGVPLFQAATANLNPWTEAKVDSENPDRPVVRSCRVPGRLPQVGQDPK